MITNINDIPNICGIYKLEYDNGKIYIGQAMNIRERALEHNSKSSQVCDKALKTHNAKCVVLQDVALVEQLDCIETFWINKLQSTNRNLGYNILSEGNAAGKRGVDNTNASLNDQQLQKVINLLKNHTELSIGDIACQFEVSSNTIRRINYGLSYVNENTSYPIRPPHNHDSTLKNSWKDYFKTEDDLKQLKEDLLFRWDLSIEPELCQKYGLPIKILRGVNNGYKFSEWGEYSYPIRKKNVRNIYNFSQEDVLNILDELKTTSHSMTKIGEKYNVHRDTISKINAGKSYLMKGYQYPAR